MPPDAAAASLLTELAAAAADGGAPPAEAVEAAVERMVRAAAAAGGVEWAAGAPAPDAVRHVRAWGALVAARHREVVAAGEAAGSPVAPGGPPRAIPAALRQRESARAREAPLRELAAALTMGEAAGGASGGASGGAPLDEPMQLRLRALDVADLGGALDAAAADAAAVVQRDVAEGVLDALVRETARVVLDIEGMGGL